MVLEYFILYRKESLRVFHFEIILHFGVLHFDGESRL